MYIFRLMCLSNSPQQVKEVRLKKVETEAICKFMKLLFIYIFVTKLSLTLGIF